MPSFSIFPFPTWLNFRNLNHSKSKKIISVLQFKNLGVQKREDALFCTNLLYIQYLFFVYFRFSITGACVRPYTGNTELFFAHHPFSNSVRTPTLYVFYEYFLIIVHGQHILWVLPNNCPWSTYILRSCFGIIICDFNNWFQKNTKCLTT